MSYYYCSKQGDQAGPIQFNEFISLFQDGSIDLSSLVWTDTMASWMPLAQAPFYQQLQTAVCPQPPPSVKNHSSHTSVRFVTESIDARKSARRRSSKHLSQRTMSQRLTRVAILDQSKLIWIQDSSEAWVLASIIHQDNTILTVQNSRSNEISTIDLGFTEVSIANDKIVADMSSLNYMHEPGLLYNLEQRYLLDTPYTYMGLVLLAVNPLKYLPQPAPKDFISKSLNPENPHPYAIAELCCQELDLSNSRDQSIVISGESGAGKTETAKLVLHHLVSRCENSGTSHTGHLINTKLLQSSPILEAFGNSKTTRNPNSSRFGKFMKIFFGESSPSHPERQIEGALIETYLLEKGRVIGQTIGEQNYHIFYQLLSNLDRLNTFLPSDYFPWCDSQNESVYRFLNPSSTTRETFREHFLETNYALGVIGYDSNEVNSVWKILGAILLLGNIVFREIDSPEGAVASIDLVARELCENSCQLLGLSLQSMVDMLTQKKMTTRGETFTLRLTVNDASYARDAFCKALYESLFTDIVVCINKGLTCSGSNGTTARKCIGVLDVFGFESFLVNGYDQLLINYANEALQSAFNTQVFKSELKLFLEERIDCPLDPSSCPDNTACIETIWNSKPGGISILNTLDTICRQPKPSDSKFCTQIHKDLNKPENQKHFPAPHPKDRHNTFLVKHFAGLVKYTVGSGVEDKLWVDRNNDSMPDSLWTVLSQSSCFLVKRLSENNPESVAQGNARKQLNKPTVAATFSKSIQNLTQKLQSTNCSFIRCIKPNPSMRPSEFDRKYVVDQMRALGLVQACEVMSVGLPNRISYVDLKSSLEHITQEAEDIFRDEPEEVLISALLMTCDVPSDSYRLGKTRVFFRPGHLATLEQKIRLVSQGDKKEEMLNGMRRVKSLRQTMLQSLAQIKNRLNDCESIKIAARSQLESFQKSLSSTSASESASISILASQVRNEIEEIQSSVKTANQMVDKTWFELQSGVATGAEKQNLLDQFDQTRRKLDSIQAELLLQESAIDSFEMSLRDSSQLSFSESALDRWQDISRLEELIRVARGLTKDAELAALRFQPQQTEEKIQKCNNQYLAIQEFAEVIIASIQKDANHISENKNESTRLVNQAKSILASFEALDTCCDKITQECSDIMRLHKNLELKAAKNEADRLERERLQREAEQLEKIENERIQREKEEQLQQAALRRGSIRVTKFTMPELSPTLPSTENPQSSLEEISPDEITANISTRGSVKFSKAPIQLSTSQDSQQIEPAPENQDLDLKLSPIVSDNWVLPVGWEEFFDADEGLPYYYNTITQTTQWERPEGPANSIGGEILPATELNTTEDQEVTVVNPESVEYSREAIQSTQSSIATKCNLNYGRITTSQLDNLGTEVKTGYLMKRSGFMGRWKKKFFVLEGAVLSYYEKSLYYTYGSGGCKEMRLSINSSTSFTDTECTFIVKSPRLSSDEEISWMLIAENESSMREWVAFINAHIHSLHRKVAETETALSLSARTPLAQPTFWYLLPSCQNPVGVRTLPRTDGPRTGEGIYPGECIEIVQIVEASSNVFLRLADDRGWVFTVHPTQLTELFLQLTNYSYIEKVSQYRVDKSLDQGISIQFSPGAYSPPTGIFLLPGEEIEVIGTWELKAGSKNQFYKLADGRGWIPSVSEKGETLLEPILRNPLK